MSKLKIDYFSDVLCIWAYSGHVRVDELCKEFGDEIELNYRFVPIFGAAKQRIARGWKDKDGFKGFNRHMQEVAAKWDHIQIHKDIWLHQAPTSSNVPHLYIKAAQLLQSQNLIPAQAQEAFNGRTVIEELIWRIRAAFFEHCRNISDIAVLDSIAKELQLLGIEDTYLETQSLKKFVSISLTVNEILKFLKTFEEYYPNLHRYTTHIEITSELIEKVDAVVDRFGDVKDNASPLLKELRQGINKLKGKINSSFTSAAGKVTPSNSKSPVSCTSPLVMGTCTKIDRKSVV